MDFNELLDSVHKPANVNLKSVFGEVSMRASSMGP